MEQTVTALEHFPEARALRDAVESGNVTDTMASGLREALRIRELQKQGVLPPDDFPDYIQSITDQDPFVANVTMHALIAWKAEDLSAVVARLDAQSGHTH